MVHPRSLFVFVEKRDFFFCQIKPKIPSSVWTTRADEGDKKAFFARNGNDEGGCILAPDLSRHPMPLRIGRQFFRDAKAECHREVRLRKDTGSTASHQEKRRLKSAKTRWTFLLTLDGIKRSDQAALRRCHPSRLPGPFRGLVVRTLRVIGRPQQVSPDMVAVLRQAARLRPVVDTPDHESERAADA